MTMAFVRSLLRWQAAMIAATGLRPPIAMIAEVDLEDAAVDRAVALEWVAFLGRVAQSLEGVIAEAESRGVDEEKAEICNVRSMLSAIRSGIEFAEEHAASLSSAVRATEPSC